jgi:hypothetical protein
MHIEYQTTADNFLYQFRETLRALPFAIIDEQKDPSGRTVIVNRILIGNGTQLRFNKTFNRTLNVPFPGSATMVTAHKTEIIQPITIELVRLDDLIVAGATPAPITPLAIFLVFEVALEIVGGDVMITIDYSSVDGFVPHDVLAGIDMQLRDKIKRQTNPLDLDDLKSILGGLNPVNAAIACKPRLTSDSPGNVAMRVEFDTPTLGLARWQPFLSGTYDNLLAVPGVRAGQAPSLEGERWAAFVSKDILQRFLQKTLEDSFADNKDMKLRSNVAVGWGNPNNEPLLEANFKAIAINVCDLGAFGRYDVRLDVQIPVGISVPSDGVLRQHLKVNFWKNDLDAAACIVTASVFWPLVAASAVSAGKLRWDFYAWLVILVPLRFYVMTKVANDPPNIKPPNPQTKKISDDEFQSDQDFSQPGKPFPLELLNYRGMTDGLLLMGRQPARPETCAAFVEPSHCEFVFFPPLIPCSHVSSDGTLPDALLYKVFGAASCTMTNVGEPGCRSPKKVPLQFWEHKFLDTGLVDVLKIEVIDEFYADSFVIGLRCPVPPQAYYADPKPLQLLVKSNGGARVLTIAPLGQKSQKEIDHLLRLGAEKAVKDCSQLIDPWWKTFHRIHPNWLVDPPAFRTPKDHQLWIMHFLGINPGDHFIARIGDRLVERMRVNAVGRAAMAVLQPAPFDAPLGLAYEPVGRAKERGGRMLMSQVALAAMANCPTSAPVRGLVAGTGGNVGLLFALHDEGYSVIDVAVPAAPVLLSENRGSLRSVAFNSTGAVLFDTEKPHHARLARELRALLRGSAEESDMVRVVKDGAGHYSVRRTRVDVFDRGLQIRQTIDLPQRARDAALVGSQLIVAGDDGLSIISLTGAHKHAAHYNVGRIDAVYASDFTMPAGSILARTGEKAQLLDLPVAHRSDKITVLAEYDLGSPTWCLRARSFTRSTNGASTFRRLSLGCKAANSPDP